MAKSKSGSAYFLNMCDNGICDINMVPSEVDKFFKYVDTQQPPIKVPLEQALEQMLDRPALEKAFKAFSRITFPGMGSTKQRTVRKKRGGRKRKARGTVRRAQSEAELL